MDHRPASFDEVIGQKPLIERIKLTIEATLLDQTFLPPILLVAPPGAGKTSICELIAQEALLPMESVTAPLETKYLQTLIESSDGIVYVDEIHCLTRKQQEYLLPVLEDRVAKDKFGGSLPVDVSIIGSTTDGDKIIRPLWDRFRIKPSFDPYTDDEMTAIVQGMAAKAGLDVDDEWAETLARATLGVPRNARTLVGCARELMLVNNRLPDASEVLAQMRTTDSGLTIEHLRYLEMLNAAGGTAGLQTMRQLLGMPAGHIELLEVDLIKQRYLIRASSGREMTNLARRLVRLSAS